MLVHLRQYKHEEVQFDDNRTTGEAQTEETLEKESAEYFGADMEELDVETWETVEYEGDPIQRRDVTISGATAVSVPDRPTDADESGLPGRAIQVRTSGDVESIDRAEIVEIQDADPDRS
ncbi:hypothetical protein [Halovivax sp.]|uniref:hypothetical protein n=1 Tax=Halovivax sp. TaxID=1935978 RepID=UPI0025BF1148|nr:hypothetical protein [Halovivax sp.]